MLELPRLLLGRWLPSSHEHAQAQTAMTRAIIDPVSRARLGIVRSRPRAWPRWLDRETWDIYETDDESLLCTIRAPWWLAWASEVYDAEERRVAIVRGAEILDGLGRLIATIQMDTRGGPGKFLARDGMVLAEWVCSGDEVLLQFSAAVASQPFAKMALLGAFLCQG
jgi:hypothetical protein